MTPRRRLIAGVTVSGTVLCLSLSASAHAPAAQGDGPAQRGAKPLPAQVADLRAKLASGIPSLGGGGEEKSALQNIVQFFSFFNCARPGWKNC